MAVDYAKLLAGVPLEQARTENVAILAASGQGQFAPKDTDLFGFTKDDLASYFGVSHLTAGGIAKLASSTGNLTEEEKEGVRALDPHKISNVQSGLQHLAEHPKGSTYHGDTMNVVKDVLANFGRGIAALFTVGLSEIPVGGQRLGEVSRAEAYLSTAYSGGQLTSGVEGTEKKIWSTTGKVVAGASLVAAGPSIFDGQPVGAGFGAEHFNATAPVDLFGFQGPLLANGAMYSGGNAIGIGGGSVLGSGVGAGTATIQSGSNPLSILFNQVTGQVKSFALGVVENFIKPIFNPTDPLQPRPNNPGNPGAGVVPNLFGNYGGGGGGSGIGVLPESGNAGLLISGSVLFPLMGIVAIALIIWLARK